MRGNIYPAVIKGYKYYIVRFGRISKTFKYIEQAERFLTGIRYETDRGTFDPRDYRKDKPLAFNNLAIKWLEHKKKIVKPKHYANLKRYMGYAINAWQNDNVKTIGYGEIEDLLYSNNLSDKTRLNFKSCLHDFWTWLRKRKILILSQLPEWPEIPYELGLRNIINLDTQQIIMDKIFDLSHHLDPKIWLGINFLRTYISVRPGELLAVKEGEIQKDQGTIIIPHPKEKKPKMIYLLDDDIERLKEFPSSLPGLYFFRHPKGVKGAVAGRPYGPKYFYVWWKRACKELKIDGVDLYGGTRHSTVTALSQYMTPEQIRAGTMHSTNKAFERYFQKTAKDAKLVYAKIQDMRDNKKTANRLSFIKE